MATVTGGPVLSSDFWDAFGTNWQENCLRWQREPVGSAIPPSGSSWQKRWTANPAFHRRDDGTLLL